LASAERSSSAHGEDEHGDDGHEADDEHEPAERGGLRPQRVAEAADQRM
jgi:hypothetical protein